MGYSIIFDTKFIKLNDGRLLHLDRSGCNNDNAGRKLSDYSGEIYTEKELNDKANSYMQNRKTEGWDLKIGSRHVNFYDYGEHLLRMAKRALSYSDFIKKRLFYATKYDGVELFEPEQKKLNPEEFHQYWLDNYGKSFSYRRITSDLNSEDEIVQALENKESVSFYVGKTFK